MRIQLDSGDPWNLSCTVEQVGKDFLCRIHGGDAHIGAVALSQWDAGRAFTEQIVVRGHKEAAIATHAAHQICTAVRHSVASIAGIHFDGITREQIEEISQAAFELAQRAAREIEDVRLHRELRASSGPYATITSETEATLRKIDLFLSTPLDELLARLRPRLASEYARRFDGKVWLFAPLYLSNACSNDCAYCGFRRSARFRRTHLGTEQVVEEARHLARQGHRTIDLVTGEVPTDRFVDYVCQAVAQILEQSEIRCINLNLGALTPDQFRRLRAAGATGYHLYQETYDPRTYFDVHRSGRKRDMAYRLEGAERAIEAGFERIGLGILLGLRPLREELAHLVRHAQLLIGAHPGIRLGFSLPRIRGVDEDCEYRPAVQVGDDEFIKAMLFLRWTFPEAHLTLTTRESPEIRNILLPLGVSKVSAGVSTAPGGYAPASGDGTGQFSISDRRPVVEMTEAIREAGLEATFE